MNIFIWEGGKEGVGTYLIFEHKNNLTHQKYNTLVLFSFSFLRLEKLKK